MSVRTVSRGAYLIKTMPIGASVAAQVLRGRNQIGPRHMGIDHSNAVAAADKWLSEQHEVERVTRRATGAPSVTAYREAFRSISMNKGEAAMLQAHLDAPWHKLTATELAKAAGWPNWSSANLHYGGLGKKIAYEVDWDPPARPDGSPIWTMTIALPANVDNVPAEEAVDYLMSGMETGGEFEWELRPQVVAALTSKD